MLFLACVVSIFNLSNKSLVLAKDAAIQKISKDLQNNLNKKHPHPFRKYFSSKDSKELKNRYKKFVNRFPNAKWAIEGSKDTTDGRPSINIKVKGTSNKGNLSYQLESHQRISLEIKQNQIVGKEIITSYSILKSGIKNIPISVFIPNSVLTGTRYDFDVIFDEPIKDKIIAGGVIKLSKNELYDQPKTKINLMPLGGGGLFKTIQSPLSPGTQYLAATLAHPDGLVSITKSVKIVSKESELIH